jgi:hypothetical protein
MIRQSIEGPELKRKPICLTVSHRSTPARYVEVRYLLQSYQTSQRNCLSIAE